MSTIAAAFVCKGGIVLCADTEITVGDVKLSEGKVRFFLSQPVIVILTGSGDATYIDMAMEKITQRCREFKDRQMSLRNLKEITELTVLEIYEKNIAAATEPKPGFSLLLAFQSNNESALITSSETAVKLEYLSEMIGIGSVLGKYLTQGVSHIPLMSLREGTILAAYILWVVKNHVPGCGGKSTIFTATPDYNLVGLGGIEEIEKRFAKCDSMIRPLFFAAPDADNVSAAEFQAQLKALGDELSQLRTEWRLTPVLKPELGNIMKVAN
jgi:hypothetical protein